MDEILIGGVEKRRILIEDYNPRWPAEFENHAARIRGALGGVALAIEHVGSTAVPGLAAKAIVDIDLIVADSSDEQCYLRALVAAGYQLRVRERAWHQHRMFRTPGRDVHIHIFSRGCVEFERHVRFRDRLRACESDRRLYESVKRRLAAEQWEDMNAYAAAKSAVVEEILARAKG